MSNIANWRSFHSLAAQGALFVAQTPTPGTGVTLTPAAGTTFSDTNAIVGVNNISTSRDLIPLWLKLIITAAGTAGTDSHVASRLDLGVRCTVGSGTQLTGKNINPAFSAADPAGAVFVLPTVAAATGSLINCGRAEVRKAAAPGYIVGDTILFLFGAIEMIEAQAMTATTAIDRIVHLPGVFIPAGWAWVLNEWMTGRSVAQSAEVEFGYAVR